MTRIILARSQFIWMWGNVGSVSTILFWPWLETRKIFRTGSISAFPVSDRGMRKHVFPLFEWPSSSELSSRIPVLQIAGSQLCLSNDYDFQCQPQTCRQETVPPWTFSISQFWNTFRRLQQVPFLDFARGDLYQRSQTTGVSRVGPAPEPDYAGRIVFRNSSFQELA